MPPNEIQTQQVFNLLSKLQ